MANVIIVGAGLGGVLAAIELQKKVRREDQVIVIGDTPFYHFVPSNPWVAVGWRTRPDIEVDLRPVFAKLGVEFVVSRAQKIQPAANSVVVADGREFTYDYLVIATGPELAFDEVPGLGPDAGFCHSICRTDHAERAGQAWEDFVKDPGPIVVGAAQGVSCFGPAYEYTFIMDADLRKRRIRDRVPMTFVTSEPYIGHLGLDGVGDTKSLLESALRHRHINWITNARITGMETGKMMVEEVNAEGNVIATHDLGFRYGMMMPPFRGVPAVRGVEGLSNPRGFIIIDKHQRNPTYPNVFGIGVGVAIAPVSKTPVATGAPKTGFMIESMVTATVENIGALLRGKPAQHEASWNAVCLADFGDSGVAFVAQPQIPPRNQNWARAGKWVHYAKIAFESYFLGKIRRGAREPFYERMIMELAGINKLKGTNVSGQ